MRRPSKRLTVEVLVQNRHIFSLFVVHVSLGKYLQRIQIFKQKLVGRPCDGKKETAYHFIFECVAVERHRLALLGAINSVIDLSIRGLLPTQGLACLCEAINQVRNNAINLRQ